MKYKKIMLVALVLLAILTIGAVSAADVDSDSLAVDDGGDDSIASPVNDADLLSDGNSSGSDYDDGDDEGNPDDEGDEGGDEIETIWVDDNDLSLDDLDNHFAYVNTPEDAEGYVLVNCGETVFFNKTLSSMDHGADEQNEGYYWHGISLNDVGKFAGLEKEDMIVFSLFDGDGQKVQSRIYFIYLGEGTIRLENDDSENLDDYTTVDGLTFLLMENMNIEDPFSVIKVAIFPEGIANSFSISLQKDDDEAIVTNWTRDSVERDRAGYAMWNISQLEISEVGVYSITYIFTIGDNTAEINVGNLNMGSEEGGDDDSFGVEIDTDAEFDSSSDLSGYFIGSVTVPENSIGNISIITDDGEGLFNKALNDFDSNDIRENTYDIRLTDNGRYIFEGLEDGTVFKFVFLGEDGNENWGSSYYRLVIENNIIRFEQSEDEDDEFDPTKFSIDRRDDENNILALNVPVFSLYCPDGSEGTVDVTVSYNGNDYSVSRNLSEMDENNYLHWYLNDLNMTLLVKYEIHVNVNDGEFESDFDAYVHGPISFTSDKKYINTFFDDLFIYFEVPSEYDDATVIVEFDGMIFNKTLKEFEHADVANESYYWYHPSYGPGPGDERFKHYVVYNAAFGDIEAKTYNVTASIIFENSPIIGNHTFISTGTIDVVEGIVENKGVKMEAAHDRNYNLNDDDVSILFITAPEGANGKVTVSLKDKIIFESNLDELDSEDGFYLLRPGKLELDDDDYELTFAYFEDDEKIVETSEFFTFFHGGEGDDEGGDADDGVVIWVREGDFKEFDLDDEDDLNGAFAYVSVSKDLDGAIVIYCFDGEEGEEQDWFHIMLSDVAITYDDEEYDGFTIHELSLNSLGDRLDDFKRLGWFKIAFIADYGEESSEFVDSREYNIDYDGEANVIKFWQAGGDADDGVFISVPNGDDAEYNLDEDMDDIFASVSVSNELNGNITIYLYMDEDEPVEYIFFNKDLTEIDNKEADPDIEGFTIYNIALSDLNAFDDFLEYGYFEIAFISEDDEGEIDKIDCRGYNIEIDEENENIIRFWESEDEDDEGMHGEGEEIDATFTNANVLNNDVVVCIAKDDLPDDVDNEFTVIIPQEDDEPMEITFKLDEILEGDNYIIRVNDLQLLEFKESFDILMILQFYNGDGAAYYAEWMDEDEPIHIYESPCIFEETSLLNDDDVITIQEIPDGVDEFTVIISKEGSDDIVKIFKFSEISEIDYEEPWVSFKLADLGINETGDYEITVKYSDDLNYTGSLNVNKNVDIRGPDGDDDGEPITYKSVDERVVNFRISENVKGYVKVYVDGTQVGENLNLADLRVGTVPPQDGRQIILNDLNITESGEYTVKVELYSEADELLGEEEFNLSVEVGENSAEIIEGSYPYGTEANDEVIRYIIGAPLSEGQYFNIYFNGEIAGKITANGGLEFNDAFTVPMFDVKIFKPGNYEVIITFFDGENETDITTGSFSINELTLTSDKEIYVYDDGTVIISFNLDSIDDLARLEAYYVYDWGPVGRDDSMIFNPYGADGLIDDGAYKDGVISLDVARFIAEPDNDSYRLDVGTNLIYVVYRTIDDEEFGGFIEIEVINEPVDPELTVTASDINVGETATFNIEMNDDITGEVLLSIDGVNYTVTVTDGKCSLNLSSLKAGTYEVSVLFAGNVNYNTALNTTSFKVSKLVPSIEITAGEAVEGSDLEITVTAPEDATGNVFVNDKQANLVAGKATVTIENVAAGNLTVFVNYEGDEKYLSSSKSINVTVMAKQNPDLTVSVSDINVGETAVVNIEINADATGNVIVNGNEVEITNGKASFNIAGLASGNHTVTVAYPGNKYFNADEITATFNVTKKVLPKTITKDTFSSYFDENGVYIADLDEIVFVGEFTDINNITINKAVKITGQDAVFNNVLFNIIVDNVSVKDLTINTDSTDYALSISADNVSLISNNFNVVNAILVSDSSNFTIDSNNIITTAGVDINGIYINRTGSGVVKNNNLNLKSEKTAYAINTHPTGSLKVSYINNTIVAESFFAVGIYDDAEEIRDNKITLSGNYAIGIAVLSENTVVDNNGITLTTTNTGSEDIDEPLGVETAGIVVNNDAEITNNKVDSNAKSISVIGGSSTITNNNLTGFVSIKSENNNLSQNTIKTDNDHAVEVTSSGNSIVDNDLTAKDAEGNAAVSSNDATNIISNDESYVEVIDAEFNYGETGSVEVKNLTGVTDLIVTVIDHDEASAVFADGKITISGLKPGEYTLNVTTVPDNGYLAYNTTAKVTVNKLDSPISIDIAKDEFTAFDDFTIAITNVTAVNVTINDKSYAVKADGTVDIETTSLDADTYTVAVSNVEGEIYKANSTSKVFTIVKKASSVKVTVGSDYKVGDNFDIIIINDTVATVTINDKAYEVKDGKVVIDTTALANGTYTVKAVIAGDGKYLANESTVTFTISKHASEVSINVGSAYNVGDNITIEITNNTAASVTINGTAYAVENGKVSVDTSKLAAGEYTVVASISENDKYLANSSTATFKLSKVETPVTDDVIPVDGAAKESKTPTYSISLAEDATGTLTVTVGDKNYTAEVVNGKASVTAGDLPAGSYDVTIRYSGDAKYSPIVRTTTTTVVVDPKVVAKQASALYTAKYSVTVYGKDGKVAKSTNVVFYINGKKVATVKTNAKGVATFNIPSKYVPKTYTIKATALGKSASKKVAVKQIASIKKVTVKKSAKKLVLTATLKKVDGKYLKNKKITFKFNGKKYTARTNAKGVAKVTVKKSVLKKLKVGKKVTYQATYLKVTVKQTVKVKK